ncbi:MAG: YhgE/Pip domain-containing protein, partial [Candidatus Woesearchaeota archaeon]
IQFVMVLFGKIGQIIAIILLMLQLTSGAGTFPIETSPGFFQFISPFMPMTHGISLLRDLILLNKLNFLFLVKETLIIFFFFLLFFFARLLITRKKLKISDIIPLINF